MIMFLVTAEKLFSLPNNPIACTTKVFLYAYDSYTI